MHRTKLELMVSLFLELIHLTEYLQIYNGVITHNMELHYGYTKIMGWFYDGPNHTAYIFIDVTENETPRCAYLSHDKLQTVFILNISNLGVESNQIAINCLSVLVEFHESFMGIKICWCGRIFIKGERRESFMGCERSFTLMKFIRFGY